MDGIVRNQNRLHSCHYLTRHAGKGVKGCLKKLIVEDENGNKKPILDRSFIEDKLIETNKRHFQQAKSATTCKDKMHNKLTTESVRNKILNGTLRRSECDTDELHAFLKLLK